MLYKTIADNHALYENTVHDSMNSIKLHENEYLFQINYVLHFLKVHDYLSKFYAAWMMMKTSCHVWINIYPFKYYY